MSTESESLPATLTNGFAVSVLTDPVYVKSTLILSDYYLNSSATTNINMTQHT